MKKQELAHTILDLAVEDYYGLWEVLWKVRQIYPGESKEWIQRVSKEALRDLLEKSYVILYRRESPDGPERPIVHQLAIQLLRTDKCWAEPKPDSETFVVAATDAGEQWHAQREDSTPTS